MSRKGSGDKAAGRQRIHQAVLQGDDCKVIDLTRWCCFTLHHVVEARDAATGATPLLLSAERGDDGVARVLLDRGASVHAEDNGQQTAMHLAARHGHRKYLELMLEHEGDMEAKTRQGMTPLLLAIEHAQAEAAFFLLERGANLKVKTLPEHGAYTPFLLAVKLRQDALVAAILSKARKDTTVDEDRDEKGRTGFFIAVQDGYRPMMDRLLAAGADANVRDHREGTPLLFAVQQGDIELLELLLQHNADLKVRMRGSGHTPLMLASMKGDREMLQALLRHGVDVNERDDAGYTALTHAAAQGHKEVVALLLHRGAAIVFTQSVKRSSSFGEQSRTVSVATGPSAMDVAANDEIRGILKAAEHCGPPVLPRQPEVRKEKLDPTAPSVLVHFSPPLPTATCPRVINLKYHAEAFVIRTPEEIEGMLLAARQQQQAQAEAEEEGHEEGKAGGGEEEGEGSTPLKRAVSAPTDVDEPVAALEGLYQPPFVFRGLERGRTFYFKVVAESSSGRGVAAYTEPILLATGPNTPPVIESVAPTSSHETDGINGAEGEEGSAAPTGSALLSLIAPQDNGGSPIQSYIIKARPGNLQVEVKALEGERELAVIFPGLALGRHYRFTAQARNAMGVSQASSAKELLLE